MSSLESRVTVLLRRIGDRTTIGPVCIDAALDDAIERKQDAHELVSALDEWRDAITVMPKSEDRSEQEGRFFQAVAVAIGIGVIEIVERQR
jgi:hypothetical protein